MKPRAQSPKPFHFQHESRHCTGASAKIPLPVNPINLEHNTFHIVSHLFECTTRINLYCSQFSNQILMRKKVRTHREREGERECAARIYRTKSLSVVSNLFARWHSSIFRIRHLIYDMPFKVCPFTKVLNALVKTTALFFRRATGKIFSRIYLAMSSDSLNIFQSCTRCW